LVGFDLYGEVNAESMNEHHYSGVEGNELADHAKSVFLDATNMLPDINNLRILQLS
jgi:hypothetical protein